MDDDQRRTADGPTYRRLQDPRELPALAHPVRLGIMELLTVSGPLTATELADRLDETPANCSWHLRKLAEHHFVEEAGGGIGRQRPWQVRSIGLAWDETRRLARARSARVARSSRCCSSARSPASTRPAPSSTTTASEDWAEAAQATQSASWLTLEELDELNTELRTVLERYADRLTDPSRRPPGSRLCEFVAWGAPLLLPGVEATPDSAPDSTRQGLTRHEAGLPAARLHPPVRRADARRCSATR